LQSYQGMRTLERLGVHNALSDEVGYRGPSGIPQIFRYEYGHHTNFQSKLIAFFFLLFKALEIKPGYQCRHAHQRA
jgi:hypothetical protein